jgi:chitodextrinase
MAMSRLRPLLGGLALGTALVFVPAGTALAATDTQAPTAPANLRVVDRQLTTISLDWDAASDNLGVVYYRVSYNNDEFVQYTTDTSYLLWRLRPAMDLQIRVSALDEAGNMSPAREVRTSTLVDTEAPTTPQDLRVTGQSATSVRLSWTNSVDNDQGAAELDYLIDDGTVTRTVHVVTSTAITGLATNRTHTFTIRARDRSGNLSGTTQVSTFIENVPPSVPTNLRQTGTADGQAVFGWDPSTDNSGTISHYIVQFHTGQTFTTGRSIRITDLIVDCLLPPDPDIVTFTVTARDRSGNRSPSASITLPVV